MSNRYGCVIYLLAKEVKSASMLKMSSMILAVTGVSKIDSHYFGRKLLANILLLRILSLQAICRNGLSDTKATHN